MENGNCPSTASWLGTLIVLSIPIVNIVYLLVKIFQTPVDTSAEVKREYCKAYILYWLINTAISFLILWGVYAMCSEIVKNVQTTM